MLHTSIDTYWISLKNLIQIQKILQTLVIKHKVHDFKMMLKLYKNL